MEWEWCQHHQQLGWRGGQKNKAGQVRFTLFTNPLQSKRNELFPSSRRLSSSTERLDAVDKSEMNVSRQHDFERKHFQRTTQCDFCGRKIWLKDGVQCRECSMCCHRKCTTKCQSSTICGPVDATAAIQQSSGVEFKVTDTDADGEIDDFGETEEPRPHKSDQHRQSFSDLISQGIKRVNSANNLAIPAIVSSLNQGSRSLPPSPQHTPR